MKTPILISERLRLRPMGWAAEKDYSAWLNDPEVVRYSELRHRTHDEASCLEYIKSFDHETNHIWAIHLHGVEGLHIGNITLHRDIPNNIAQMGILIGEKSQWNKGLGVEAWGHVMTWGLANGLRKVEAGCMSVNTGMIRVFQKTGMKFEGLRDQHFAHVPPYKYADLHQYRKSND